MGPYTWDDFLDLPEDDRRELLDGWLVETEMPTFEHEAVVAFFVFHLFGWARQHGGRVVASGYKVKVGPRRGVMPDVQYYRPGRTPPSQALVEGAPDIGIEVVSSSSGRYDRVTKLNYYCAIGLPEYWLVDPAEQSVHRFLLHDGRYAVTVLDGNVTFAPESLPGLSIPLDELWAQLAEPSKIETSPESTDSTPTDEAQ